MIASISQFKIIIALSLTLAACCAGMAPPAANSVAATAAMIAALHPGRTNFNGCKCGGTGYLAACSKANRWLALFGASTTCKPNDRDHLQEWHDPCPRGRPHGHRATRRRLSIWQYLNEMIGNVGREVKIQRGMQRLYKCLGKKPQPHVLMDLLNATQGWPGNHGLEPPLTKTEAFEYLGAFKPTRRRLNTNSEARASAIKKAIDIARRMESPLAMQNAKYRLMEEWDLNDSELEAIIKAAFASRSSRRLAPNPDYQGSRTKVHDKKIRLEVRSKIGYERTRTAELLEQFQEDRTNKAVMTSMKGSKARMNEIKKELMAKHCLTLTDIEEIIAEEFPTGS